MLTIEDVGITWCDTCKNLAKCKIVYAYNENGLPIRDKIYGKIFCDSCWDKIHDIKKYRIKNPYNNRIRCASEESSHPCITCGTYIDKGLLWCPGDRKCLVYGKRMKLCISNKYGNGSSTSENGIHQYEKFERQKYIGFMCKNCKHEFTIVKPKCHKKNNLQVTGLDDFFGNDSQTLGIHTKLHSEFNHYKRTKKNPSSGPLRHECFKRDRYRCRECGATNHDAILEINHIIPKSQGGCDELCNLQTLCMVCNRAKHNRYWIGGNNSK